MRIAQVRDRAVVPYDHFIGRRGTLTGEDTGSNAEGIEAVSVCDEQTAGSEMGTRGWIALPHSLGGRPGLACVRRSGKIKIGQAITGCAHPGEKIPLRRFVKVGFVESAGDGVGERPGLAIVLRTEQVGRILLAQSVGGDQEFSAAQFEDISAYGDRSVERWVKRLGSGDVAQPVGFGPGDSVIGRPMYGGSGVDARPGVCHDTGYVRLLGLDF